MEQQKQGVVLLSPAELKGLKKKLRSLGWCSEAVMREVALIQKLRLFLPPRN